MPKLPAPETQDPRLFIVFQLFQSQSPQKTHLGTEPTWGAITDDNETELIGLFILMTQHAINS